MLNSCGLIINIIIIIVFGHEMGRTTGHGLHQDWVFITKTGGSGGTVRKLDPADRLCEVFVDSFAAPLCQTQSYCCRVCFLHSERCEKDTRY